MILVDTSVLVGYLKGSAGAVFDRFDEMIAGGVPFGINGYIYQEVLRGRGMKESMLSLPNICLLCLSIRCFTGGRRSSQQPVSSFCAGVPASPCAAPSIC